MNILKKTRVIIAIIILTLITLLFLDVTGVVHLWLGWVAKIQFIPALLALNVAVLVLLIILTLLFGRIYCSVICPLGIFQDVISRVKSKKNKFNYLQVKNRIRYSILLLFIVAFIANIGSFVALLEPYSAYGRITSNLFAPIYGWANNLLAYFAERANSYTFYETEVFIKSIGTFVISIITLIVIIVLAWKSGRIYCNTICPVGTILGFLSKFSLYKHRIDEQKCNSCGLCARNCKASCIDAEQHTIDYSRCVTCFNCIDKCNKKAIKYRIDSKKKAQLTKENQTTKPQETKILSRRNALTTIGLFLTNATLKAQAKKVDGGLAFIEDKKIPIRQTPIVPAGAGSIRNFNARCTGCQLCVSNCTNQVLRPSSDLLTFMQPEVSYERGYCRPECTKCSEVCPSGAIKPITVAEKAAIQVGHAVWIEKNCVTLTDNVDCGNCANHCPTGAIQMILRSGDSFKTPAINIERCIGCGACETLCPSRPFSAIYVEGHQMHRTI